MNSNIMREIFINRELSFLKFNKRVLEEADDINVPLYEKFKFISIFHSNLDEFYMIRVGSLYEQSILNEGGLADDKTNWSPAKQLNEIFAETKRLYAQSDDTFARVVSMLREHKINLCRCTEPNSLSEKEKKWLKNYFKKEFLPLLSPQIIDAKHPFPHLFNKEIYIWLELHAKDKSSKTSYGIIMPNKMMDRIVEIPLSLTEGEYKYVLAEDLLFRYAKDAFKNYKIISKSIIRITRNADISVEDYFADYDTDVDYRAYMKDILKKRGKLAPVRLEVNASGKISSALKKYLCSKLNITSNQVFVIKSPLDQHFVFALQDKLSSANSKGVFLKSNMFYTPVVPNYPDEITEKLSTSALTSTSTPVTIPIMKAVETKDIFLSYPQHSMRAYLNLLHEALEDNEVVSIKITLYRLSIDSQVIEYLCRLSENHKDVTVVVELLARFDEENNINWSRKLEEAGCNIIYGVDEYKVHSKITLITKKNDDGISYITHIATGNYNEKTAKLYTDLGIITSNEDIGKEATQFFNSIATSNITADNNYSLLLVAPFHFKSKIINLINDEIEKSKTGGTGCIRMKMNSLTDKDIICELVKASQNGVKIDLVIRGICCLLPGVEGFSENINIISIVGRFLEHSRIFIFGTGSGRKIYISSADLMTRNTTRRVEIAAPVLDETIKDKIERIFDNLLKDNVKARRLCSNSHYEKILTDEPPYNSQLESFRKF